MERFSEDDLVQIARKYGRIDGRHAEDCQQTVLLHLWQVSQKPNINRAYLVKCALTARLDFLRSFRGEEELMEQIDVSDAGTQQEHVETLTTAIGNPWTMLFNIGFSMPQISRVAGCSYATVWRRIRDTVVAAAGGAA